MDNYGGFIECFSWFMKAGLRNVFNCERMLEGVTD